MTPLEKIDALELRLPVITESRAQKLGFVSMTTPIRVSSEGQIAKSIDRSMRGATAAWVKIDQGNIELWRLESELEKPERCATTTRALKEFKGVDIPRVYRPAKAKGGAA